MYNVTDLPAVRAQAARAAAEAASPPLSTEPTNLPSQEKRSTVGLKPILALDNGRYYVIDEKK